MTLNSKLTTYKEEASRITEESKDYSYMKSQIINLAQRSFNYAEAKSKVKEGSC